MFILVGRNDLIETKKNVSVQHVGLYDFKNSAPMEFASADMVLFIDRNRQTNKYAAKILKDRYGNGTNSVTAWMDLDTFRTYVGGQTQRLIPSE
jgi:hypothetical protein